MQQLRLVSALDIHANCKTTDRTLHLLGRVWCSPDHALMYGCGDAPFSQVRVQQSLLVRALDVQANS